MKQTDNFVALTQCLATSRWSPRWLGLSVFALALAGIFSIIIVVGRTPQLAQLQLFQDLFHVSLVVHVDLSVLVWFLAMTCFAWSWLRDAMQPTPMPYFDLASWSCMAAGMLLMALSPLSSEWTVLMSNYIPVITNQIFFLGLALVMASVVIGIIHTVPALPKHGSHIIAWAIYASVPITALALAAFAASYAFLDMDLSGLDFYETIFWAGGHILQFTYVQIMLVAWIALALALNHRLPARRWMLPLIWIGLAVSAISPLAYLLYPVSSQEHKNFFTLQMDIATGAAGIVLGIWLLWRILNKWKPQPESRALHGCLKMSLLLFAAGGLFGAAINGPNVRIPAHYHGSIVAVTLALMGLAYALLPRLGFKPVAHRRLAIWQPYIYGGGQLLHISGLAWSGGYGVLRKTPGALGEGMSGAKIAMGVMGAGGGLAILGGLLFVIVLTLSMRHKQP